MELNLNYSIEDMYWQLLKGLSSDIKVKLINRLSESLIRKETKTNDTAMSFYGAWSDDERSAEDIVAEIRNGRHFRNRDNIDML